MNRAAVLAFNASGADVARRVADALDGETFGLAGRVDGLDRAFDDAGALATELFGAGRPILGVCAAGILIRLVAPLLRDKRVEPPVLAISDDGAQVVPLLGGLTGGDALARHLAQALDANAAITGAGARRFGLILESPPEGFTLANPDDAKAVTARLLAGAKARLDGDAPWISGSDLPLDASGEVALTVSADAGASADGGLLYRPKVLVAEFDRPDAVMLWALDVALADRGLAPAALALATAPEGAPLDHVFVDALAQRGVPLRIVDRRIPSEEPVHAEPGLRVHRFAAPVSPETIGRAPGRVTVIGLGPGGTGWRTPEAAAALDRATDLVGYEPYLAMAPERAGQRRHGSDNRVELERAQAALMLAEQGRDVAVLSSGDSGVFGMATAVMEALAAEPIRWPSVTVSVAPGVSAMQAAAARLGAPLGHDFAVISLSDYLKPWEIVAKRLAAAAEADLVLALYNPASLSRREQLDRTLEILRARRGPETVVALARNIGRDGERVTVTTLGALDPDLVDMRTLIIVGSSRTRVFARADGRQWVFTPRSYLAEDSEATQAPAAATR